MGNAVSLSLMLEEALSDMSIVAKPGFTPEEVYRRAVAAVASVRALHPGRPGAG